MNYFILLILIGKIIRFIPFSNSDISLYNSDYVRLYNKYSAVIKNMDDTVPVAALSE